MEETVKLELRFGTSEGKTRTLSVNQPALDLEPGIIQTAMEAIAAQGIFEAEGVNLFQDVKGARYVTRTVEDVYEVAEA